MKTRVQIIDELDEYVRKKYPELTPVQRAETYLTLATVEYERTSSKLASNVMSLIKKLLA